MPSGRNTSGARLLLVAAMAAVWLQAVPARAQATQDPTALALINQGLALLDGGTSLSDVTLQATVTYTSGSDIETGTGTLQALGDGNSLVVLNLTGGQRQYILKNQSGLPAGAWVGTDGSVNLYSFQNCWSDGAWFFPGLVFTSLPGNPQVGLVNLGSGTWNGQSVNQVQLYQSPQNQAAGVSTLVQAYSTENTYLDPTSGLPLAIDFNLYADANPLIQLTGEVQFSNYQSTNGMSVPFHVQRMINGAVVLDIVVTSVTVNSGLSPNLFNIP
ncbi:MAG TPA: hypothetical protein VGZ29_07560 [Terriglobia bacterium]|nr:hypothetical protein [Terriglobia bacterium]